MNDFSAKAVYQEEQVYIQGLHAGIWDKEADDFVAVKQQLPFVSYSTDVKYFLLAASLGYRELLKQAIAKGIAPNIAKNYAIKNASARGHHLLVQDLLCYLEVDPAVDENFPLYLAVLYRKAEVVKTLLQNARVDPSAYDQRAINVAATEGSLEVIEALLQDKRVNPGFNQSYPLRMAAWRGHAEVVKRLLLDTRVDPTAMGQFALLRAVEEGKTEVVRILCEDGRVNPALNDSVAIINAANKGHKDIVEILLKQPGIDPCVEDNKALRCATVLRQSWKQKHARMSPGNQESYALSVATGEQHKELVTLVLQYGGAIGLFRFLQVRDIDATYLPFPKVRPCYLKEIHNIDKALLTWKSLYDHIVSPPIDMTIRQWRGCLHTFSTSLSKEKCCAQMQSEGLDMREVEKKIQNLNYLNEALIRAAPLVNRLMRVSKNRLGKDIEEPLFGAALDGIPDTIAQFVKGYLFSTRTVPFRTEEAANNNNVVQAPKTLPGFISEAQKAMQANAYSGSMQCYVQKEREHRAHRGANVL